MPINGHFKAIVNFEVSIAYNTQIYETFLFLQIYLHVDIQLFKKKCIFAYSVYQNVMI